MASSTPRPGPRRRRLDAGLGLSEPAARPILAEDRVNAGRGLASVQTGFRLCLSAGTCGRPVMRRTPVAHVARRSCKLKRTPVALRTRPFHAIMTPRPSAESSSTSIASTGPVGLCTPGLRQGAVGSMGGGPCLVSMVGAAGFEPATTCAQDRKMRISLLSVAPRLGRPISQSPNKIAPKMLFQFGSPSFRPFQGRG